jgi:hypothetical protein
MLQMACIVEGHGDVRAVPILVRRIAAEIDPAITLHVLPPLRVPRFKLAKEGELERAVELAARKTAGAGAVLVLVDSEDDCPATKAPELLQRARAARSDVPAAVVLAKREYEAWFLAAAESLRGHRGLAQDLTTPAQPEEIRGAKEWLRHRMPADMKYRETLDQLALTAVFDLAAARRADSFDKCYREITRLLQDLQKRAGFTGR